MKNVYVYTYIYLLDAPTSIENEFDPLAQEKAECKKKMNEFVFLQKIRFRFFYGHFYKKNPLIFVYFLFNTKNVSLNKTIYHFDIIHSLNCFQICVQKLRILRYKLVIILV